MLLLIRYEIGSVEPTPSPQINVQEVKNYLATQPLSQNILPDSGYDAMSRVFLSYNIPSQNKEVTITNNGTTTVYPDEGYYSLQSVSLTTNVPTDTIIQEISCKINKIRFNSDSNLITIVDSSTVWTVYDVTNQPLISPGSGIVAFCYNSNETELKVEVDYCDVNSANGYIYVPTSPNYWNSKVCYLRLNYGKIENILFKDDDKYIFLMFTMEVNDGNIIKYKASGVIFNTEIDFPSYSELYKN